MHSQLADIFTVLAVYAGIVGVVLGSYFTYYFQDMGRRQNTAETVLRIGSEVLFSLQDLQLHVGMNENKLERVEVENWARQTPKTRAELNLVLDNTLEAFPFPLPEVPTSSIEEPYSVVVKENIRSARKLIQELNESAGKLRTPMGRTDENIASFLGRLQIFRNVEMVTAAIVAIEGNLYEALFFAKGTKLGKRKKQKLLRNAREAIREDYESKIHVLRVTEESKSHFAETLKDIK